MPINDGDVQSVAQGLADTEEMTLQVSDGNQAAFVPGAIQPTPTSASQASQPGEEGEKPDGSQESEVEVDLKDVEEALENDDGEFSDEEIAALKELRDFLKEEAKKEIAEEIVPKLQSTYDRQISSLNRKLQESTQASQAREKELLDAVREAKLNGLSDAEKAQLKATWDFEDRMRALDAREQELTSYHTELLREAYATEYASFGLTADDLAEFSTPEEMELFVNEVQLEYYKQLAQLRASGQIEDEPAEDKPGKKSSKPAATKTPAGAAAPSDGGGGAAVQSTKQAETGTGTDALYRALKDPDGWERVQVR